MWKVYGSLKGEREDPGMFKSMMAIKRLYTVKVL